MLAGQTDEAFNDPDWIFEIKWDGYRAVAETGDTPILYSRNGIDLTKNYPTVIEALEAISHDAILDGEIIALQENGLPSFEKLQQYNKDGKGSVEYYLFDLIALDGKDTTGLTLLQRKELLKELIPEDSIIRYTDHIRKEGELFFETCIQKNLEGIMAKNAASSYFPGKRSSEWLKIKGHNTAEVVIIGFTKPTGSRTYFGALLIGIYKGETLHAAGKVGTGFDRDTLKSLYRLLEPLIVKNPPKGKGITDARNITWVKPELICTVKFTEWTSAGSLRHPVFMHLRTDKSIQEANAKQRVMKKKKSTSIKKSSSKKKAVKKKSAAIVEKAKQDSSAVHLGKITVPISNPDKIYWPKEKISKKDLVDYYQSVADYILPFLKDRPQSLKRNPDGIRDKGFYHKDAGEKAPDFVKTFAVHSESSNKQIDYIICNNKASLAYLNNLGCIELNPWHATYQKPDNPDYLIIDIDPSEKNDFEDVITVTKAFKKVLDKAAVEGYCKTSGATGMHIYLPMKKKYDYETVKGFAELLCVFVHQLLPDITTMERSLKKRKKNEIYLDYLQNNSGQTICSVYSVRPREGATVSMPIDWSELKKGLRPEKFTIHNALSRIKKSKANFKAVLGKAVDIQKAIKKLDAEEA